MQLINIKRGIIFFGIFTLFLYSCKDKKAEQKQLQEEVMKVHDELMMEMGKLMENKKELNTLSINMDSLKMKNASLDTAQLQQKIQVTNLGLTKADDAMMAWMNNFNPDYTGKSQDEIMSYLKDEKVKIDSVKTLFKKSLSTSGAILIQYK
ncbi:MAG: hypothetical protein ABIP95_13330 [Pelobium sp.]